MGKNNLFSLYYAATAVFALGIFLSLMASALGQPGIGSGENPWSENRRVPFTLKMSGFLNTKPEEGSVAVVNLGIHGFQGTYQFEVVNLEAPDYPRLSTDTILQQMGKHAIDFNVVGPKELLSKIGQAEPGTPLRIVGGFQQRSRTLQLLSVDIIGMTSD